MQIEALLDETLDRAPGRTALGDGKRLVTYGELAQLVIDEARFIQAQGGLRCAILADNGCSWVIGDLALHHLNRLCVPLPAWFAPTQQDHIIDDAGIDTLLTDRHDDAAEKYPQFRAVGCSPFSGLHVLRRTTPQAAVQHIPVDVTKITYTSGSTASPKGVCLSAATIDCVSRSVGAATRSLRLRRYLCLMPLPTLLENVAGIQAALRSGVSCTIPSLDAIGMSYGRLDPERLLHAIEAAQPESLMLVPELLRLLVRAAQCGHRLPASLKFIAVGGAVVSKDLLDEAADLRLPVYEGYGLSECASVVCLNTPGNQRRGSVGKALPHVRVRVDDQGQIRVRGAVMSGYLGDEQPRGAEIETGDLGETDADGYLYIRGRKRNVFVTSLGRNVSPEWIERELSHEPVIRHALAFGEAQPAVSAILDPTQPAVDPPAMQRAVDRANLRLPEYAQVRRWVRMPESPTLANGMLTANGRLRRERVLERFGSLLLAG